MDQKPIVALDFPSWEETERFLKRFNQEKLNVKIGMELFYQNGFSILDKIRSMDHEIFLDLKLHDIPNTVYSAMKGLARFDIQMVNVHAAGGSEMMMAAHEGLKEGSLKGRSPQLIAVTQLTSTKPERGVIEQQLAVSLEESAVHYAQLTKASYLDGVVCSVWECPKISSLCGKDFLKVTPGIRLSSSVTDDQARIATPYVARKEGSTHIVVGRPITASLDPVAMYHLIKSDWEKGSQA